MHTAERQKVTTLKDQIMKQKFHMMQISKLIYRQHVPWASYNVQINLENIIRNNCTQTVIKYLHLVKGFKRETVPQNLRWMKHLKIEIWKPCQALRLDFV